MPHRFPWVFVARLAPALLCGAIAAGVPATATTPRFHDDDPLLREPETQDASRVQPWTIDLFVDLAINLFGAPGDRATAVRAQNVNTIDEVPDSSWFTNRVFAHPVTVDAAVRGPAAGAGLAPGPWTVIAGKETGVAPGFTIADASGERWFVSFDARGYPEAATAAIMVANRIFWALGYWQVENVLTRVHPEQVLIGDTATIRPPSGRTRRMRRADLDAVWRRAQRSDDGTYRAVAARHVPGKPLGGFRFHGTRPDDPNDLVPHEHRRELRALKVFGAWTNLVDMKAGNTLDVLVTERDRTVVRHYLQDVGSTFGTGALAPREFDEGWEHLYEPDLLWRRMASLGFVLRPWQTVEYEDVPAVGRFEGVVFDPTTWKPRVPTAALRHAQADDLFWAARRVAAFSDPLIRAIVRVGGYSDPDAERHLAEVLIQRRDKIAAAYLPAVNPVVNLALSADAELTFENAAVNAGVAAAPRGYRVRWGRFDNATGAVAPIGETVTAPGQASHAPAPLPAGAGAFVRVEIEAIDSPREEWARPLRGVFRREAAGWRLVGLERGRS
jgi:hypothetical protein